MAEAGPIAPQETLSQRGDPWPCGAWSAAGHVHLSHIGAVGSGRQYAWAAADSACRSGLHPRRGRSGVVPGRPSDRGAAREISGFPPAFAAYRCLCAFGSYPDRNRCDLCRADGQCRVGRLVFRPRKGSCGLLVVCCDRVRGRAAQ